MQKKPQRRSAVPGRSLYEKNAQTQRYGPAAEGGHSQAAGGVRRICGPAVDRAGGAGLHTTTGFLCAATGFALIDILNRNSRIKFQLSPVYVALAAFCFSMTVGVLWEFFEFGMDRVFHLDMQKDTVVQSITSVMLDPTNSNTPITIDGIHSVAVNGTDLGFDGYLDIGLYDTMEDLFVNFIGAVTFSVIGYFYIKHRGKGKLAQAFIPTLSEDEDKGASLPEGDPGAPPESE